MKPFISIFCLFILLCACNNESVQASKAVLSKQTDTHQMIDSINSIISQTNFRKHLYESGEKLKLIKQEVEQAQAAAKLSPQLYIEYAQTLLNAGESQKAIDAFETLLEKMPQNKVINKQTKSLHEALALAYLRLGEQKNCIENHTNKSCLFPIKGKGIHTDKTGSTAAIKKYKEILAVFPQDLRTRWLLNLAYMTLGEYPQNVPPAFLMPPHLFVSEHPMVEFENISSSLGIDVNDLAGGVILDDFNNDNWTDIIVSSWGMFGEIKVFFNNKKGGFEDQTKHTQLQGLIGGLNLIQADYNNDGHLDFYVIRGAWRGLEWMGQLPNSLIKNNGDGTFSDVTFAANLYDVAPTQSAVWFDFNNDGHIDLFVGNETITEKEIHKNQLFVNNGDGTFTNIADQLNLDNTIGYIKGVAAGDINNDNLPDLYISFLNQPNKLLLNKGGQTLTDWVFEDVSKQWGVEQPIESFPTWFFDYNNDGWEDIFVASFDKYSLRQQSREVAADYLGIQSNSDWPRLYLNKGGQNFEDATQQANLKRIIPSMGANYGDLDNDGYLDFYLGTGAPDFRAVVPNRMFRNHAGKVFQDVTFAGNFGHVQKGHGISFADLDNDGDQDIYAVMGGSVSGDVSQNALFENPGSNNNWINIRLIGHNSNKSAIGAKIKLTLINKNNSTRTIYSTLSSGGSFGANSLSQEIGLGEIKSIKNLAIRWPNGNAQYIDYGPIKANQFIQIEENSKTVTNLNISSIPFDKSQNHHHHHQHH